MCIVPLYVIAEDAMRLMRCIIITYWNLWELMSSTAWKNAKSERVIGNRIITFPNTNTNTNKSDIGILL